MRVLWLLKTFGRGGAERLLLELAPYLDGVEVVPVATHADGPTLVDELRAAGLEPVGFEARGSRDLSWVPALRRLVREVRPDLVHAHAPVPAVGARLVVPRSIPLVSTAHNVWSDHHPLTRFANALTHRRDTRTIAVSEAVRASVVDGVLGRVAGADPIVITNGIDVDAVVADARVETDVPLPARPYGAIAHLRPHKGVDVLVRAAGRVRAEVPDATCVVVGDGDMHRRLDELSRTLRAGVHLLGTRIDARAIAARFEVFVSPGRSEGLPMAILEAMALGRPIVATAVGGTPDVLTDGVDALLVPPGDVDALATAIVRLLTDEDLARRLGMAARGSAQEHHAKVTAASLLDVYHEVLGR